MSRNRGLSRFVPIPLLNVAHPVAGGDVFNAIAAFSKPSGN
jgi:hypothetical protein